MKIITKGNKVCFSRAHTIFKIFVCEHIIGVILVMSTNYHLCEDKFIVITTISLATL